MNRNKRRLLAGVAAVALTLGFFYWLLFLPHYRWGSSSPGGKFRLDIYEEPRAFMTMPGNGSHRYCKLVLRNRWGWKIGQSSLPEHEGIYYSEKEFSTVEWNFEEGFVWLNNGDRNLAGFNLATGQFEY